MSRLAGFTMLTALTVSTNFAIVNTKGMHHNHYRAVRGGAPPALHLCRRAHALICWHAGLTATP